MNASVRAYSKATILYPKITAWLKLFVSKIDLSPVWPDNSVEMTLVKLDYITSICSLPEFMRDPFGRIESNRRLNFRLVCIFLWVSYVLPRKLKIIRNKKTRINAQIFHFDC